MPTLPTKMDLGQPGSQSRSLALAPNDWPDTSMAPVANAVARGAKAITATLQTKQDEADAYEIQKAITDFDLDQEKRLDDAKRNAAPEAKGFTEGYRANYDTNARELMTRIPDHLKPKVDEALVRRGAAFEKRAYDFELAERDRWNIQDVNQRTSDAITRTMSNPDTLDDNAARGVADIRASRLSQRAKIDAEKKFLDMNAEYGIKALIDREIEGGKDAGDIIQRLRRVPRGTIPAEKGASLPGDGGDIEFSPVSVERRVGKPRQGNIKGVVVHYTEGSDTIEGNASWSNKTNTGAHYYIGKDGKVFRWADDSVNMPHAGVGRSGKRPDLTNESTIGIEIMLGKGEEPNDAQIATALRLIAAKSREHGFTKDDVFGHGELTPGHRKSNEGMAVVNRVRRGDADPSLVEPVKEVTSRPVSQRSLTQYAGLPSKTMTDAVERKDLPAPGEVAAETGDGKSPRVEMGEDGQPRLMKDDGAKTDLAGGPTAGEATLASDELEESDQPGWHYLTPGTRRKLINYARTAGRAVVTKGVDDDIARLRLGKEPEVGPDGRTSLDRARAHMTNMQWAKKSQEWQAAKLEHQEISGLRSMSDSEMADYKASIVDRAEAAGLSVADAARIQKKADTISGKIMEMRNRDPVRAITGSIGDERDDRTPPLDNVAAVMKALKQNRTAQVGTGTNGSVMVLGPEGRAPRMTDADETANTLPGQVGRAPIAPRDQWGMMFAARLKDQETVMPDSPEKHRIISRKEAEQLLTIPRKAKEAGNSNAFKAALREGWERAQRKFPPEYADRAFREAVNFAIDGDIDGVKAEILARVAKGRPVTNTDFQRLRSIEELDRVSIGSGIDAMARIDRAGRSQGLPAIPIVDPALPAIATVPSGPTQGDVARGRVVTPKGLPKSSDAKEHQKAIPPSLSVFERATRWFTE